MSSKLLAIETATEACSCALAIGERVEARFALAPRRHAELVLDMIDRLLVEAATTLRDLDAIAFGRGPGSFTGLRIAAGVAQGLALGAGLPLVPVSSLAALARGARAELGATRVIAALDARMGEVYWGAFSASAGDTDVASSGEAVSAPEALPALEGTGWWGVGSGFAAHGARLRAVLGPGLERVTLERYPHARDVAHLAVARVAAGETVPPERALPVYLRDRVTDR